MAPVARSHRAVTHLASFSCWSARWATHRRVYVFKLHPAARADSSVGFSTVSTRPKPGCGVLAGDVGSSSVPACRGTAATLVSGKTHLPLLGLSGN